MANVFAAVCVLGAPGAGKGTLCSHLSNTYSLAHYSVGDNLRVWMRENRNTPLALRIQDKLDNQGFLSSEDLDPLLCEAIKGANNVGSEFAGILLDGFPRCIEQLSSFESESFQEAVSTTLNNGFYDVARPLPDLVLFFDVSKSNAKARYLARARARDDNDSEVKFERRFAEFEAETLSVVEEYRRKGILICVDADRTIEENIRGLMNTLEKSAIWQTTMAKKVPEHKDQIDQA